MDHADSRSSAGGRRAFTLVELLAVIGIIALLVGILLPVLGRAREAASRIACGSNQRQIVLAILMYANERGRLPGPCIASINNPEIVNPPAGSTGPSLMTQWSSGDPYNAVRNLSNLDLLHRYTGSKADNKKLYICPSARAMWDQAVPATPASEFAGKALGYGYMVNNSKQTKSTYPGWLFGTYNRKEKNLTQWADSPQDWTPKKLTEIFARTGPANQRQNTRDSTKVWLVTDLDGRNFGRDVTAAFGITPTDANTTAAKNKRIWQPVHKGGRQMPYDLGRNFTFLDGHTEWVKFSDWPNNDEDET